MPEAPVPATGAKPALPVAERRLRRRVSVVWALVASFGGLLLVSVLAVFGFSFWSASENTIDLLRIGSEQSIKLLEQRLREHLDEPADQLKLMVAEIGEGRQDPERRAEFDAFLTGAISGLPQVRVLSYVRPNLAARGAMRTREGIQIVDVDVSNQPSISELARKMWASRQPGWTPPLYNPLLKQTMIAHAQPVIRDGQITGVLVAIISTEELAAYVDRIGTEVGGTAFILYGQDRVLAHRLLANKGFEATAAEPLPAIERFADPVLPALWDERYRRRRLIGPMPPLKGLAVGRDRETYPVIYTELEGYSDKPLLLGIYVRSSDFREIIDRLILAALAGAVAIIGAVLLAIVIGRRLARPVLRLSEAAALVGDLRLADVKALPESRVRELDEQARAFNAMIGALRWFEAYVPRPLARHLLKAGSAAIASENRHLTVMFTDIVGFSTLSEGQDAGALAAYLNHHFDIVGGCIEAEGGIVDKYIGDCVMAFWGAPGKLKNRAERACRAALAMRAAIEADNALRRERGERETRMRIGIHSGDATVGNIGFAGRINYTIVGDMVNAGQRIEQLGKVLGQKDQTVIILVSETTRADLGPDFSPRSLGFHKLRGRKGEMEIFAL
jgi:class 3 adenylate cyclase